MDRIVASWWYLAATALCCGLAVGFASWVTDNASSASRVAAALIALVASLIVMLVLAWGLAAEEPAPDPAPVSASPPQPAAAAAQLAVYLEQGRALRDEVELGASSERVDAWIDRVRDAIAEHKPGVAAYFQALAAKTYADDAQRLDAHIARLTTIVRELL